MGDDWPVEHRSGSAQQLHDADPARTDRHLIVHHPTGRAVVLGSTQPDDVLRPDVPASLGYAVARRRSGGGAVALVPDDVVWVDVVLPRDDVLWHDDVERATWWLGEAWAAAIAERLGDEPASRPEVHRSGVADRSLGRVACFASSGPGEVAVGGRKVVGISQRRTRELARFQCLVNLRWDPEPLLSMLSAPAARTVAAALRSGVGECPTVPGGDPGGWSVVEGLVRHLP